MNDAQYKLKQMRTISLFIGYAGVMVLIYACLMPNPPDTSAVKFGDKVVHLLSYAALFLWFAQIYQRHVQFKVITALVFLGIALEFAQDFTGYRSFEYADMLANSLGVLIGWIIAATPIASVLQQIEQKFLINKK